MFFGINSIDPQWGNRFVLDKQLINPKIKNSFTGIIDRQARFLQDNQLLDPIKWQLFVEQFRLKRDDDLCWRSEYFGKMMRGAAMTYQYTGNEALYICLENAVKDLLTVQDDRGRFTANPDELVYQGWDIWGRKYVILGLLHFYEICRDDSLKKKILTALEAHLDSICDDVGDGKKMSITDTSIMWLGINSASILEAVMRMYNVTHKKRYLDFAQHIVTVCSTPKTGIFTLALEDKLDPYQYPVKKAYEMMSCFEGLLEYYRATGEEKWRQAVIQFVNRMAASDISIIGCAGCEGETLNHAVVTQTDIEYTNVMQETCVSVTWMKLCNQLLGLTGDPKYADYIENTAYNALYGAMNNQKSSHNRGFMVDSYSPLTKGTRGRLTGGIRDLKENVYFGCCVAIAAAGTALVPITAVVSTEFGYSVNYYEKGLVRTPDISFELDTQYPCDGNIRAYIVDASDKDLELQFRIPGFASEKTKIRVNGDPVAFIKQEDTACYVKIFRKWNVGDIVDITLDYKAQLVFPVGMPDKPYTKNFVAIQYGPLVMARDARLGDVGSPVTIQDNNTVDFSIKAMPDIECVLQAKVNCNGNEFEMVDYGSAGKTWDEESLLEAWMPVQTL